MIAVVKSSGDEPYHVRITNDGSDVLVAGEQLHNQVDALKEIVAVAEQFGMQNAEIFQEGEYYALKNNVTGFAVSIHLVEESDD